MKNTMYTLGMIYRAIWPTDHQLDIIEVILKRPASGLTLMAKHQDAANKTEEIAALVDRLQDISDPLGGVPNEDQLSFWLGYYHYPIAVGAKDKYGAKELRIAGEALFGERWQTDLSRELGLSDARRIRQWLTGDRPIPVGVWADICGLLRQRQITIERLVETFEVDERKND